MIAVQGPGGVTIQFPDGTDAGTIGQVMQQQFGGAPAAPAPAAQQPMSGPFVDPYKDATLGQNLAAVGHAADNAVRNFVNGATLGYADKLAAAGNTAVGAAPDYQTALAAERAHSGQAMAESPGGVGQVEQMLGMAVPASVLPASTLPRAMASGAALGGLNAAGNDQDVTTGAIMGGLSGGAGSLAGKALVGAAGFAPKAAVPTTQDIKDTAQAAYQAAENAGVMVSPGALARLKADVLQTLADNNYRPELHPGGVAIIKDMERWPGAPTVIPNGTPPNVGMTLKGLDGFRQIAGQMADNPVGRDAAGRMGALIQGKVDNFVNGLTPADVVGGQNPAQAVAALNTARQNWMQYSKARDLEEAMQAGANRASVTGSGGNINNATRQEALKTLNSRANWTPDEHAALQSLVNGTPTQNALRQIGKLSPQGNGLIAQLELMRLGGGVLGGLAGYGAGGLGGAAALGGAGAVMTPAVGIVAKTLADRGTQQAAQNVLRTIQNGGKTPVFAAPFEQGAIAAEKPLSKALMLGGIHASLDQAPDDGRSAALASVLAGEHPGLKSGLGSVFAGQ